MADGATGGARDGVAGSAAVAKEASHSRPRLVDIGANLLDPMFQGEYRGSAKHPADLESVLERARAHGVDRVVVTAGTLADAREALAFVADREGLFTTVGVHPTRCGEFESAPEGADAHEAALREVLRDGVAAKKVVAVGECGLDYDRLQFCAKEVQLRHFERHVRLAEESGLPLFLHDRNTGGDFLALMRRFRDRFVGGVVHSFTGPWEDAEALLALDLFIGLNGCSLRTEEGLEVVRRLPLDRILLETDAPWCGVKPTHPSHTHVRTAFPVVARPERFEPGKGVKDRNEPAHLVQVAEIVAAVKGVSVEEVAAQSTRNAVRLFRLEG